MSLINFDDHQFDLTTETFPTECHFCKKTYPSYCDFSKSSKGLLDGLYACCEECMTLSPCTVDDHTLWTMTLECGSISFDCEDKCSIEDASRMKGWGSVCRGPGGDWQEYAFAEFPVTIKFDRGSPDWETGVYDDFSFDVTLRDTNEPKVERTVTRTRCGCGKCIDCDFGDGMKTTISTKTIV